MRAVKAIWQNYRASEETFWLLEQFRRMLNGCIQIGLAKNVTSLKSLSLKAYKKLNGYDVPSCYKLCAISRATGILRNYRKAKRKGKRMKCASCGLTVDRDVNAARNILARGVRFAPVAQPVEAMVVEPQTERNPQSRWL